MARRNEVSPLASLARGGNQDQGAFATGSGPSPLPNFHMPSIPPILVVDDEPTDTYFLRRTLKQAGVPNPVIGCGDGEEAISFLESAKFGGQRPCLIFLDMKMPRMNGPEFLTWIRGHAEFADLKIIVVSSSARPEDRSQALALGAHDYVVKFPAAAELLPVINGALAGCASEPRA